MQNVTLEQALAVSNAVLETEIFCHRYVKIDNSAIRQYFQIKLMNIIQNTSASSAQNLDKMHSDLTFLSSTVWGFVTVYRNFLTYNYQIHLMNAPSSTKTHCIFKEKMQLYCLENYRLF